MNDGIFSAFRAIGYVSTQVPLSIQVKGTEVFLASSIGTRFHVYNVSKINFRPPSN
jgi:U3 small nucleolar RNA-associated protein 21